MRIDDIIRSAREKGASDIHITEGLKTYFRINGTLAESGFEFSNEETKAIILEMMNQRQKEYMAEGHEVDFATRSQEGFRQRVNVFYQQGRIAATIRLLNDHIPNLEELNLPRVLEELANQPRGLVLVTGPTGSGKSTTLAAIVNYINRKKAQHIVTIEDPIEYVFEGDKSIIHQREVGIDTLSFGAALRAVLREDPDVILVGEMRDYETIGAAITAAETGHLVLATLHTTGAAQSVDRIIDACPGDVQNQVRTQLSGILKGIVTQCLIPTQGGQGRVPATEILVGTDAALNLIRENKAHQMSTIMQSGQAYGMHTLNKDLIRLVNQGFISIQEAYQYSNDKKDLEQFL
ncbi:twitching motility protein PilT [Aequitasia blattaphilus]|uniref:Type IV pilus twitching motility protein PilT n=1 Tax=Aequitasia blattaphilus TaxID=2949332 RepID=A0ABT1E8G7_9FIRM|nr:type IV pilus twitching motility protein PilT [Aequitasia blattaphilus]MCP1101919.1 type IV pilus twitching motility protein PilT [Aequitasia blattaphilus]MCR8614559.1 type IV pilus twitching motility protein PilT [Aequitasia blattaphilus]